MSHRLLPFSPERYHGTSKSRPYFEGWYFKQASANGAFSVIPGIFRAVDPNDDYAFIQVIFSKPAQSFFIRYPANLFCCHPHCFELRIGSSFFSMDSIQLDIKEIVLKASLCFSGHIPIKKSLLCPSIMGPFAYLPGMQCNHGVLSLHHHVNGYVRCGTRQLVYENADGYIEKDWGSAFPQSWIWMQCSTADASFMCAAASIPIGTLHFTGLIGILRIKKVQFRFMTYTGARLLSITVNHNILTASVRRGRYRLSISAKSDSFGNLKAPTEQGMNRVIKESIDANYDIELRRGNNVIYSAHFDNGGLEISGAEKLIDTIDKKESCRYHGSI